MKIFTEFGPIDLSCKFSAGQEKNCNDKIFNYIETNSMEDLIENRVPSDGHNDSYIEGTECATKNSSKKHCNTEKNITKLSNKENSFNSTNQGKC